MKRILAIGLLALTSGCSLAVRAELLNPINRGGRIETSTPEPKASPSATPAPTPTPEAR